jgi:hypothetical protein
MTKNGGFWGLGFGILWEKMGKRNGGRKWLGGGLERPAVVSRWWWEGWVVVGVVFGWCWEKRDGGGRRRGCTALGGKWGKEERK